MLDDKALRAHEVLALDAEQIDARWKCADVNDELSAVRRELRNQQTPWRTLVHRAQ